jgi:hypothetical protein
VSLGKAFPYCNVKVCKNLSSHCAQAAFYIISFSFVDTNLDGIIIATYSPVLVMLNLNGINKLSDKDFNAVNNW